MTQHLDDRKKRIIREIMKINDESSLEAIENQLAVKPSSVLREKILRPVRATISLEEMNRSKITNLSKEKNFLNWQPLLVSKNLLKNYSPNLTKRWITYWIPTS